MILRKLASTIKPINGMDDRFLNALRPELKAIIVGFMDACPAPLDYYMTSLFAAVSVMLGNKVVLNDGKFHNTSSLWIINVGSSGTGKSHPMSLMLDPISEIDQNDYNTYRRELAEFRKDKDAEGQAPIRRQLMVSDVTPEGLYQVIHDNPHGIILYRDEIMGWFDDMGRYNKSGEETNYISIWDGKYFDVTRKSYSFRVENPFLTIIGSIQPNRLKNMITQVRLDNGFAQRILFANPTRKINRYTDMKLEAIYTGYYKTIMNKLHTVSETELKLDTKAKDLYKEYYDSLCNKMEKLDDDVICSMYGKFHIYALRLSIIAHYILSSTSGSEYELPKSNFISEIEMEYSLMCCDYFEQQFLKVLDLVRDSSCISKKLNKGEAIRAFFEAYPNASQKLVADSIGTSKQYISDVLKGK